MQLMGIPYSLLLQPAAVKKVIIASKKFHGK
jgi:hypothetical protein